MKSFPRDRMASQSRDGPHGSQEPRGVSDLVRRSPLVLRDGLRLMADLAWPVTCVGCGQWNEHAWCSSCLIEIKGPGIERTLDPHGLKVHSAVAYEGPVSQAITAYKDEGRRDGAPELVALLRRACAQALCSAPSGIDRWWLVPIPSTPESIRRRGFAPLDELGQGLAGAPRWGPRLSVVRSVADQSHLGRLSRQANVEGAFRVKGGQLLPPRSGVLLYDDVVTSGATMNAAVCALRATQPTHIVGATIASTRLKVGE